MVSLIRKYQQSVMIFVTVLVIVAFVAFWNGPTGGRNRMPHESDDFGKMYGDTVTKTVLRHEAQKGVLAGELQLDLFYSPDMRRYSGLAVPATSQNEAINNFAWNSLVLRHEADLLQIEPTDDVVHSDDAVAEAIKALPKFQTADGQFDPAKYSDFVANYLPSLGFSAGDLEEVIGEDLRMKKIKALLKTTFAIPPDEFLKQYTLRYQKTDASVIRFNAADFTAGLKITDEDIKTTFEQHLEGYKSDEKRGIEYAIFSLSDADQKLTGKAHIDALQKLSNSVQAFTQALQDKGAKFDDVAAKLKVPVTNVPPFSGSEPDPKLEVIPGLLETVFLKLTDQNPVSDPLPDEKGTTYYVVNLKEVIKGKLLTLEEARPQIVEQIKNSRGAEALTAKAHEVRTKIQADIAAGKSFAEAAKAEGQKVEAYPPFSLAEPDLTQDDARQVLYTTLNMKEGDLSDFVATEAGGVIIHVDKHEPIDPKKYETDRARLQPAYEQEQVDFVFSEWLRKHHIAANITAEQVASKGTPVPAPQQ